MGGVIPYFSDKKNGFFIFIVQRVHWLDSVSNSNKVRVLLDIQSSKLYHCSNGDVDLPLN